MTASSRGTRAAMGVLRSSHPRVCTTCLAPITIKSPSRRHYAVAAAVLKTVDNPPIHDAKVQRLPPVSPTTSYTIKSGILLSRPPILTKTPSPFESAFFFYQKRLNERLVMPFTRYFYFKKDTPADSDYKIKAKERNLQPARELGGYNAYGDEGWNDELLVGDARSGRDHMVDSLVRESEVRAVEGKDGKVVQVEAGAEGSEGAMVERPEARVTEADKAKDQRRLDRKLGRTLYLVVKRKDGGWGFPAGKLDGRENLHQGAERVLVQTAGLNMNTWLVSHAPIGHYVSHPHPERAGEKTFFMKGRIMAGQADLSENKFGMEDFKWLTKQEVEKHVGAKYYSWVRNMLADR